MNQISDIESIVARKARMILQATPQGFNDSQIEAEISAKLRFDKQEARKIIRGL